ncbi:XRE family transcriptional regulator [Kitasatospora sp. NPDC101157]|uniref:XRE family transcriptional regulator n=1 Tax=Kitasatospora sp. NPDC101157 TaxID=3364098 RepID=UPI00380368EC
MVTALTATLPGLDHAAALEAVTAAGAAQGGPLRDLDQHLAAHPQALVSGDSHCPPGIVRLALALHAAGHAAVPLACTNCGRTGLDLPRLGPAGRLCNTCAARNSKGACDRCGRTGTRLAARRAEGRICYSCYRVDPDVVEECAGCGQTRMPVTRRPDNSPLCVNCWQGPLHACSNCGTVGPAKSNGPGGPLCSRCHHRFRRPVRECGRCGRLGRIARRATGARPDTCEDCCDGPSRPCSTCGEERPCQRGTDGAWLCRTCRPGLPPKECCRCGRTRRVHTWWPIGPVCSTCYTVVLDTPAICSGCGRHQPLIGVTEDGAEICGACAGTAFDYTCRACGLGGRTYADAKCARCVLGDRLQHLLAGSDGHIPRELQPLREALAQADRPRGILLWLRRSPNAALFASLAATGEPITHQRLDQLPLTRHLHYVRHTLVHLGTLPERDEELDRIPAWLDTVLADRPTGHVHLVRSFAHWHLLRRARRRAAHRRRPAEPGSFLRTRVLVALEFLAWLDEHRIELGGLEQEDLDRWLDAGNTRTYAIRYFLSWTTGRGLTGELKVPSIPRQQPSQLMDEEGRWQLLKRCLTDSPMALDTRAAGALILLFGLHASHVRHLTATQLTRRDGNSYLTVDRHPILLPPRLAKLLHQLADAPHTRSALTRTTRGEPWLFPGLVPGRPTSQTGLSSKLLAHGIDTSPARNAALVALSGDLPAPVLASILGLHPNTAVRWAGFAKTSWADYLAARARDIGRIQAGTPTTEEPAPPKRKRD